MHTLVVALIGTALACIVVAIHDATLQYVSRHFLPRRAMAHRWHVAVTVLILCGAHVIEIVFFALVQSFTTKTLGIGALAGTGDASFDTYLYFSFSSYTSLGVGDIYPVGGLRLLSGFEALLGLLMIGWSASFLLIEMREFRSAARKRRRDA